VSVVRYKAILVERERYIVELRRYVHLNPVIEPSLIISSVAKSFGIEQQIAGRNIHHRGAEVAEKKACYLSRDSDR